MFVFSASSVSLYSWLWSRDRRARVVDHTYVVTCFQNQMHITDWTFHASELMTCKLMSLPHSISSTCNKTAGRCQPTPMRSWIQVVSSILAMAGPVVRLQHLFKFGSWNTFASVTNISISTFLIEIWAEAQYLWPIENLLPSVHLTISRWRYSCLHAL